ncbi:MAG: cellulase family glycosylhydrolase [Acidobacteriaceae bacterium]|nr:cellulase family glycosylhydrolase [Acidobacteriaceae bacterium]
MPLGPGFVCTDGTAFRFGGRPFRLAGANNYYLGYAPDSMVVPVFDLAAQLGLNVLRTWAFLDCDAAGSGSIPSNAKDGVFFHYWDSAADSVAFNDGPNGLERLDRTIALAELYGIRLILPLVNYWDDFGGVKQYLSWFALSSRHQFYSDANVREAYRDYLEHVLLRVNTRTGRPYKDEPAILAWELANEPRCVRDDGHGLPDGTDILIGWVDEMSAYLKSLDANHLVAVGDEGFFRKRLAFGRPLYNGSFGVDCERFLKVPAVDFGTCHLYPDLAAGENPVTFGTRWIREHVEAGQRADKPLVIEEYGWKIEDPSPGDASRDTAFNSWLHQIVESGSAGALVWMIASVTPDGRRYPDYDRYTIYAAEDTPSVVAYSRLISIFNQTKEYRLRQPAPTVQDD